MRFIGNLVWFIFGGIITSIMYFVSGLILCLTIVGIPFGLQAFKLSSLSLWPFGKTTKSIQRGGCLSSMMNLIWIIFAGLWISIAHMIFGLILAITIIGIPFAKQHFKLAALALTPFGVKVNNDK